MKHFLQKYKEGHTPDSFMNTDYKNNNKGMKMQNRFISISLSRISS